MPDLPARKLASTSAASLPMEETMPIPVMTTRRMSIFLWKSRVGFEKCNLLLLCGINDQTNLFNPPARDVRLG